MPTLTVHNAEIRTATVEVKSLTIGGKQVTQSVFKQLPDRDLVTNDGRLNGQPWGRVNYHPDKCADGPPHLHVVWQIGNELFRSSVATKVAWPNMVEVKHGERYLRAKTRVALVAGAEPPVGRNAVLIEDVHGVKVRIDPGPEIGSAVFRRAQLDDFCALLARLGPDTRTDFLASRRSGRPETVAVSLSAAVRAAWHYFDESLADLGDEPLDMARSYFLEEVGLEVDLRRRHRDIRTALLELPQLFIAV